MSEQDKTSLIEICIAILIGILCIIATYLFYRQITTPAKTNEQIKIATQLNDIHGFKKYTKTFKTELDNHMWYVTRSGFGSNVKYSLAHDPNCKFCTK